MGLSFSWLSVGRETRAHGVDPGGPYTRDQAERLVSMASPWKPGYCFFEPLNMVVTCAVYGFAPRSAEKCVFWETVPFEPVIPMPFMQQGIWILYTVSSSSVYQLNFLQKWSEAVSSLLTVPNDDSGILSRLGVVGLKRTWDQKLSSGSLLTFMSTHFFQFRFAETEQCWLITLTFFRTCGNTSL